MKDTTSVNITIDDTKCTKCGLCVQDCVQGVFRKAEDKIEAHRPGFCSLCGHCIAVCPADAVHHSGMDKAQIRHIAPLPEDAAAVYRDTVQLRRSVRQYKDKSVPKEIIEELLNVARYSPSSHNSQNVRYTVITDRKIIRVASASIISKLLKLFEFVQRPWVKSFLDIFKNTTIAKTIDSFLGNSDFYKAQVQAGRDMIFHDAPALILLHAKPVALAGGNCFIAATNIANYATALGLGTCFVGLLTESIRFDRTLKQKLGIPKKEKLFVCLACGYPKYNFQNSAARKPLKIKWI
jgi:nitroreductase/Pyruvate/2-oxoacid:ferredoxin oxidoreductase delta subunit